jgi:FMN phosphatase YigB (HAD superfamily)
MHEPALIFDFGNVVCFFDYLRAWDRFGGTQGLTGLALRERLERGGFASLLGRFESGRMAPEEFAAQVMDLGGLKLPYEEFVDGWQGIFWLNEPIAGMIGLLKSDGYTVLLGSNTNVLHSTFFRRQFAATLDRFDHLVLSHVVGHVKPGLDFYRACVSAAGVPAASCVFIDDLQENVEGARRAGLTALHFIDAPTLVADLRGLGVNVAWPQD